ncbi:RusA family crossover junction endodeoxyribonuclease [Arthrobacter sp. UYCu712]|uniref:RusA family crossover junction endodeoxyribonuclease n=1 Tax=Arthrobacter sp. UYCu712 TaxID=3156340 RepID=UPI003392F42E
MSSAGHQILVTGTPATQGSKSPGRGGFGFHESDKKLPAWRKALIAAAKASHGVEWEPLDGCLTVNLTVWLYRPKGTKFKDEPAGTPDLDKLQRAVGDALKIAGTIVDDARITTWVAGKRWAIGCEPGATITIHQKEQA